VYARAGYLCCWTCFYALCFCLCFLWRWRLCLFFKPSFLSVHWMMSSLIRRTQTLPLFCTHTWLLTSWSPRPLVPSFFHNLFLFYLHFDKKLQKKKPPSKAIQVIKITCTVCICQVLFLFYCYSQLLKCP